MKKKFGWLKFFAIVALINCGLTLEVAYAAPGTLDPTFGSGGKVQTNFGGQVLEVWIQPNGKIVTEASSALFRLNADGSQDPTFGVGGTITLNPFGDFAVLPNGKILATTTVYVPAYQMWYGVVYRFDADGHLDATFGDTGKVEFDLCYADTAGFKIGLGINGQFFVAATCATTPMSAWVKRFSSDGTDTGFSVALGPEPFYGPFHLLTQPDGKLIVQIGDRTIRRYDTNGTPDGTFGNSGTISINSNPSAEVNIGDVEIQSDGKILVSSYEDDYYTLFCGVKRYNSDGTPDSGFNGVIGSTLYYSLAIQSNGRILVGGMWGGDLPWRFGLNRLRPNGSLDQSFGQSGLVTTHFGGVDSEVHALAIQPDGKIVAAGMSVDQVSRIVLARYENEISRRALFDFDGDGRSDVSVFRPATNEWHIMHSGGEISVQAWGSTGDEIAPADFDGDDRTDLAVYRDGVWWILNSSNQTVVARAFGLPGDRPVPADYSGDGRDEIAVYRDGEWWSLDLSNEQTSRVTFGLASDKPVVGDFDGDGIFDQAIYRGGQWWINGSREGIRVTSFGLATDRPVPADYDGDGRHDPAVYRDGTWYIQAGAQGFIVVQFGLASDIPVPADYDGDGKADPAIFRDGTWWIARSTGGIVTQRFGVSSDVPVPGAFAK